MSVIEQIEQRLSQIDQSIYQSFQSKIQSYHHQKYSSLQQCLQPLSYKNRSQIQQCIQNAQQQQSHIQSIFNLTKQSYIQCYQAIQQVDIQKEQLCLNQYELHLKQSFDKLQFKQ